MDFDDDARRAGREGGEAFLGSELPHWAARGLAYVLIALFVVAVAASVLVRVPETVAGHFVLVPVRGTDPIRSARTGLVVTVGAVEGVPVAQGSALFLIRSQPVGDRFAELKTLEARSRGAEESLTHARARYESQRLADEGEGHRLRGRLQSLARIVQIKRGELALAREVAGRYRSVHEQGLVSWVEKSRPQLEGDKVQAELEQALTDRAETQAALVALQHGSAARHAEHLEKERALQEEIEQAGIRMAPLAAELSESRGSELRVAAPCAGTVLRLLVRGVGAVVQEGDVLGEFACAGERLQAELAVPQAGVAQLHAGLAVKLLYDAFPYQRYGVRYGSVRWVSPGSKQGADEETFRVLADVADDSVTVGGERRPLLAGMGGRAEVLVGRRTLISYAFEPIRQLKEAYADAPHR